MSAPLFIVDAFTAERFAGNPAAVCLLEADDPRSRDTSFMQSLGREMNLAETAFPVPRGGAGGTDFDLRWFTPEAEVALCGHATLASVHVLRETGRVAANATLRFHTKSGVLTATANGAEITLDFPATPAAETTAPPALLAAVGARPVFVGRTRFDWLLELGSAAEVRALRPDLAKIAEAKDVRGVIVCARSDDARFDFISRFFAPAVGVPEDPVTGSAHCALTPHFARILGKTEMTALQASRRTGVVRVRLAGDRVLLSGRAVTVVRGALAEPS